MIIHKSSLCGGEISNYGITLFFRKMEFNKLFKEVLMKAVEQSRVTTGIFNCAKQLQMYV
jgi:hypothetical protein